MAILFVIPIGLIAAVTGVQVTLNVLAEFIGGGGFAVGDALAMNYFKVSPSVPVGTCVCPC